MIELEASHRPAVTVLLGQILPLPLNNLGEKNNLFQAQQLSTEHQPSIEARFSTTGVEKVFVV